MPRHSCLRRMPGDRQHPVGALHLQQPVDSVSEEWLAVVGLAAAEAVVALQATAYQAVAVEAHERIARRNGDAS